MSEQNVEMVHAALDAFRRGDVVAAFEHADSDLVSKRTDPDGAVFHGCDGLLALMVGGARVRGGRPQR
jgi:ketosteroid isomerase-like protein